MKVSAPQAETKLRELLEIIVRLRAPDGCPWDRSQKKGDIALYLIEEACEVLEALEGDSPEDLKEEIGDLLFQVLFLARIAEEAGEFDAASVLGAAAEKMIRRHPHVFGDARVGSIEEVRENWKRIKREVERRKPGSAGLLDGIPRSPSALAEAQRITARASEVGFDWKDASGVLQKVEEELGEFRAALAAGDRRQMAEEAGDLLFTLVNLCRFVRVDAEAALRISLEKFRRRFSRIESELTARGKTLAGASPVEMDRIWEESKGPARKAPPRKPRAAAPVPRAGKGRTTG